MSEEDNIYIVTDRDVGSENGVARLVGGKVPETELPSYVDDVKDGYYYDSKFYVDAEHTQEIVPEADKIYIDLATNKTYRWSGSAYAMVGGDDPPVPIAPTTSSSGLGKPADAKLTGDALESKIDKPSAPINSGAFALLTSSGNVVTSSVFPSTYVAKEITTIAIGTGTTASNTGDIAIGRNASGQGESYGKAVAVGYAAVASGRSAAAFGDGAHAAGSYTVAIGSGANASGNAGVAIGSGATASGRGSVAVGGGAKALGSYSVAIGYLGARSVTGTDSVQLGSPATDLTENYTFRFRDTVVVNSCGKIPVANLDTVLVKTVNGNGPDSSGNAVVTNVPQLKSSGSGLSTATITDSGTIDVAVPPPPDEYHGDWKDVTFCGWSDSYYFDSSNGTYYEVNVSGGGIKLYSGSGVLSGESGDTLYAQSGALVGSDVSNPIRFTRTAWPDVWIPSGFSATGDPDSDPYPTNIDDLWHYCGGYDAIFSPGHALIYPVSYFNSEHPEVNVGCGDNPAVPAYVDLSGSIHMVTEGTIDGGTRERGSVTKTVAMTDQIPTVPTKLSQLNNDAGYITATRLPYAFRAATSVLYDRSINSVSVSSGTSSLDLELPLLLHGYSRDFMVRLCTVDTSLLTVTFKESTSGYSVFEAGKTYSVGNRCASGDSLYECTTAHSGAWNASHFKMVTADVEIGGSELADWNKAGTHLVMLTEIAKDKWFAGKRFEASA